MGGMPSFVKLILYGDWGQVMGAGGLYFEIVFLLNYPMTPVP